MNYKKEKYNFKNEYIIKECNYDKYTNKIEEYNIILKKSKHIPLASTPPIIEEAVEEAANPLFPEPTVSITVKCPVCQLELQVKEKNTIVKCTACETKFKV
jgi:hypothetical protein